MTYWPGWRQNHTTCWGRGALGSAFSFLSCSERNTPLDASSLSGSGYTAGSLTSIGRNVTLSYWKIGVSTQVSSGRSLYHCPETLLRSTVSPNTNVNHASCHLWTLHAPKALHEVYLYIRVPDLFALPLSTQVMGGVISPLGSKWVGIHWLVSIPTTSLSCNTLQSVTSGEPHSVELFHLLSEEHASNFSQQNPMPLHHPFPSLYHSLQLQVHLNTTTSSDNTSHKVNGIPL